VYPLVTQNGGVFTISAEQYMDRTYGINEQEENYKYIYPLSNAESVGSLIDSRFYCLIRDNISLTWTDAEKEINISLHDEGYSLVNGK